MTSATPGCNKLESKSCVFGTPACAATKNGFVRPFGVSCKIERRIPCRIIASRCLKRQGRTIVKRWAYEHHFPLTPALSLGERDHRPSLWKAHDCHC